jgi:PucR C-terminal helix-turn-helix domain
LEIVAVVGKESSERSQIGRTEWPAFPRAAERIRACTPKLGPSLVARFVKWLPFYALLPPEMLAEDITAVVDENLSLLADLLHDGRAAAPEENAKLRFSAARRAQEGLPLDSVLTAYHLGASAAWQELAGDSSIGDAHALADTFFGHVEHASAVVAAAYVEEQQTITGVEEEGRGQLLSSLLGDETVERIDRPAGIRVPASYAVLSLAFAIREEESSPGPEGSIASNRKLRELRDTLDRFAGEPVLCMLGQTEATVLLPLDCARLRDEPGRWKTLQTLVDRLGDASGAAVTCACEEARSTEVGPAVASTREVLRIVTSFGRPAGLYRLSDVLLEYQLTRTTPVSHLLASLLDPLEAKPELLETLRVHLANDLHRKQTAANLHVHPNTLDYRLRRVAELTGLDISTPGGLQRIAAALALRAMPAELDESAQEQSPAER